MARFNGFNRSSPAIPQAMPGHIGAFIAGSKARTRCLGKHVQATRTQGLGICLKLERTQLLSMIEARKAHPVKKFIRISDHRFGIFEPVPHCVKNSTTIRSLCDKLRCGAEAGKLSLGLGHQPRREHKSTLMCTRMWQRQTRVIRAHAVNLNDVDIDGARAPDFMTYTTQACFKLVDPIQEVEGCHGQRSQNDGIPIIRLRLLVGTQYSARTNQGRNLRNFQAIPAGHFVNCSLEDNGNIAQISTKCEHYCARSQRCVKFVLGRLFDLCCFAFLSRVHHKLRGRGGLLRCRG